MKAPRPRTTTAVRFPPDIHAALVEAAEERDVSINWLVNRAVAEFLPRLIPVEEMLWTRPVANQGTEPVTR